MRNFLAGLVATVAGLTGVCLPGNALVIDDFEEGPFSIRTTSSTTVTVSGLSTEHVVGGERGVTLGSLPSGTVQARASLALTDGDDGAAGAGLGSPECFGRCAGFALELTYAELGGVDLTSGGAETTLVLAPPSGSVSVTIDGQTLSTSSGRIPLASFDQIDPTHVDEISIRLATLRGGFRRLSDVRTVAPAEVLPQCRVDLGESNLQLYDAQVELAQCAAAPPFTDADGDGEADATDACPGTPAGLPVDGAGCARAQFCAARAATCKRNDWLNDEPTRKAPGDCFRDKRTRTCD